MIVSKGIVRKGQVVIDEPIDLPDGSEVTILARPHGLFQGSEDHDRSPTAEEIAAALAAMDKVEPFEMSEDERAAADAWEKQVNDYSIANADKGIEDLFR